MIDFTHLHVHTTFSILDGYGLPWQYFDRLKEIGHSAMGITDHGNVLAHIPFEKEAIGAGVKIIFGCEFYVAPFGVSAADPDLKNSMNRKRFHLTVMAKNRTGLTNLHKLITYSNLRGFYYKPRIDFETLLKHKAGLIVLSGCMGDGVFMQSLANMDNLDWFLKTFKKEMGGDFYAEVSPLANFRTDKIKQIIEIADDYRIPIVSTSDTHFPAAEDHTAEDLSLCIGMKDQWDDPSRMKLMSELYLFDGIEAEKRGNAIYGSRTNEFFARTLEIENKCHVTHPQAKRKKYSLPLPEEYKTPLELFNGVIEKGVITRGLKDKPNWPEYEARLEREVSIITSKDYIDYFLICWNIITWAAERMLVGPARGSVAGSLTAFVMGITQIDPMIHGLMFERFIDVSRLDDPDIDMDFPAEKRGDVIAYMVKQYGQAHASLLGNVGKFKSKNALWDTRRVFNLPWGKAKELAGLILERSSGDARSQFCLVDSFTEFERARQIVDEHPKFLYAGKIEGQARQTGIHAAAVVLTDDELENYSGFMRGRHEKEAVLSMDMYSMKYLNILKMDILGLKQLSVFETVLDMIGKDAQWLYDLPLDDHDSYKLLRESKYWGIFQFEGDAVRFTCSQCFPDTFLNLSEISALARPGALHSGGTTDYLDRRAWVKGYDRPTKKKPQYLHPLIKEIASETYGVIIYQEQVMRIMRDIGNMSWSETTTARIGMGKAMGVEYFDQFKKSFMTGAGENGVPPEDAEVLWDSMQHFGSWAFNKSHSIAYGHISYWCMYLKAHYPDAFYTATLQKQDDEALQKKILREYVESGGELVPFDFHKSQENFSTQEGILYGGWSNLKGIGEKAAKKIIAGLPFSDSTSFRKVAGSRALELLKAIDMLPTGLPVGGNQLNMFSGEVEIETWGDVRTGDWNEHTIMPWSDLYPIGEKYVKPFTDKGYEITHAIEVGEHHKKVIMLVKIMDIQIYSQREETMFDKSRQNYRDKYLDRYLKIQTEDDTESMLMGISRYLYETLGKQLVTAGVGSIVIIKGTKIPGFRKINIQKMRVLEKGRE